MFPHRNLLGIAALKPAEIVYLLDRADAMVAACRARSDLRHTLRGKTVVQVFFEASTRTRTSFEIAGKRLGADVINIAASTSSVTKGESLRDTVKNIEAMGIDAMVIRHASSGAADYVAEHTAAPIVNAGDGAHEHPTQALLDALTIRRHKKTFEHLIVAICGDIQHSRVARSNALLLGKLGAEVRMTGPRTLIPREVESLGPRVRYCLRLDDALEGADVVMALRIQNERLAGALLPSTREYSRTFGVNEHVLRRAKSDAIVMHPGPINRGVELETRLADASPSMILGQVEAGVAVRMAVLEQLVAKPKAA